MVRRTVDAVFSPGAHVFPGGALDPEDRTVEIEFRCDGLDDSTASAMLGVPAGGLGYFVAAAPGVLRRGRDAARPPATAIYVTDADVYRVHRDALNAGERSLLEICVGESLTLAVDLLLPFGHWITPIGPPRRFDTRFFVAPAPPGQDPSHDGWETTEGVWMRPERRARRGRPSRGRPHRANAAHTPSAHRVRPRRGCARDRGRRVNVFSISLRRPIEGPP